MNEKIIERTLPIAAPRIQVFRALMDPGTLSRWLFASVTMNPEAGSAFSFEWRDSTVPATAQGKILELIPDRRLVLSWFMQEDGVTSTAGFDLEDGPDGGTVLRFTHSGLPQEPEWGPRFRSVALEWDKVLLNLRFVLEERGEGKHLFYFRTQTQLRTAAARAFRAWTTPMGLSAWLAQEVSVLAEEEKDLTGVTLDTGKALSARFHRIEPDRHLRMTWSEGGVKGLIGVSVYPQAHGVTLSLTLRSFQLLEMEREYLLRLWNRRFQKLAEYLAREPYDKKVEGQGVFTVERSLEAPPLRVWNAITDAALLRRWLVTWSDFRPDVGSTFAHLWEEYGETLGRVEEIQGHAMLRHTWDLPALGESTRVIWRVTGDERHPGRSHLSLEHSGWWEGPTWDRQRHGHETGWTGFLALLEFYLAHGAGRERRAFRVRRKLPIPPAKAAELFTTGKGLQSWVATRATVQAKPGGSWELELPGGGAWKGTMAAWLGSGDGGVVLEAPEPAFVDWYLSPEGDGTVVVFSVTAYTAPQEWLDAEHARWRLALDKLAGSV